MEKLVQNELFKNDLKSFVGTITPYLPYVGIISGLLTIGGYVVYEKACNKEEEKI